MSFWTRDRVRDALEDLIEGGGNPDRLTESAYELSLGRSAYTTDEKEPKKLNNDDFLTISPGEFAIVMTSEEVRIPDNAFGMISLKNSLKQRGLINVSGFNVDPGWQGPLKFAVFNAGPRDIVLAAGMPTFLLWLADLVDAEGRVAATSKPYTKRGNTISAADIEALRPSGTSDMPRSLSGLAHELDKLNRAHTVTAEELKQARSSIDNIVRGLVVAGMLLIVGIILRTLLEFPRPSAPASAPRTCMCTLELPPPPLRSHAPEQPPPQHLDASTVPSGAAVPFEKGGAAADSGVVSNSSSRSNDGVVGGAGGNIPATEGRNSANKLGSGRRR